MTWTRRRTSTSVDVDIDEFSPEEMLQGLIDAKYLSEAEAEKIRARADRSTSLELEYDTKDIDELEAARDLIRAGKRSEAMIHLERFLGREWIGVLQ